jgi:O-antigen/teichoic acid export membrane protein
VAAKNYFFSFLQRFYSAVLLIGTTAVVSRWLTPTEIGVYSLGFAFVAILNAFKNFGIQNYIVVNDDIKTQKISSALFAAIILSWPLGLAVYFFSVEIADFYQQPGLVVIFQVQSLAFFLWPFIAIKSGLLQRALKFKVIFWVESISATVSAGVTLVLIYTGYGVMSLAIGAASLTLITFLILSIVVNSPWLISTKHLKDCMRFGGITTLIALVALLGSQGLVLILGKLVTVDLVAQFERAQTVPILYWNYIYPAIASVLIPTTAKLIRTERLSKYRKPIIRGWISIATASAPLLLFLSFVGEELILILYGEQWVEAGRAVFLYCISAMLASVFIVAQATLYSARKMKQVLFIQIASRLVLVLGVFAFHTLSLYIIGVMFIIHSLVFAIFAQKLVHDMLLLRAKHYIIFSSLLLGYTLPLFLVLKLISLYSNIFELSGKPYLILSAIATGVLWAGCSIYFKHPSAIIIRQKLNF